MSTASTGHRRSRRACRPARQRIGALVPAQQDRSRWDSALIGEGLQLFNAALVARRVGGHQLLASIAALHDEAGSHASTRHCGGAVRCGRCGAYRQRA